MMMAAAVCSCEAALLFCASVTSGVVAIFQNREVATLDWETRDICY